MKQYKTIERDNAYLQSSKQRSVANKGSTRLPLFAAAEKNLFVRLDRHEKLDAGQEKI